ncbi:MAG: hypothetical protein GY842_09670 [bacterium]|nr:hypothetical protein [bacterium]
MSTEAAQGTSTVRELIDRACARDAPAELHFPGPPGKEQIARVRLIKMKDNEIYADAPLNSESRSALARNRPVEVHTVIGGERYSFRTRIQKVFTSVDLNARKRITAITLAVPTQLKHQQRRQHFRVSVAGHGDIEVAFCATVAGRRDCCPINGERFAGRLVNVSSGGICVIVPVSRRRRFRYVESFFVEFQLDGLDQPVRLPIEVRHFRRIHDDTDTLLGLRFRTDVALPTRLLIQDITRFIASEERRQLRRERRT